MTVSQTERLQIYRWTQDTDAFTRLQMDESHENLEDRVARYVRSDSQPVAVANEWARSFWLDQTTNVVYFYTAEDENGSWKPLNLYGTAAQMSTTSGSIVGYLSGTLRQTNSAGTRDEFARIDHQHELPAPDLSGVAAKSTLTGKGSIYAATGASTPGNLSVGSNNYVLVADSSTSTGLKWDQVKGANIASSTITYDKLSLTQLSVAGNLSTTGTGSLTIAGPSTLTGNVTASGTMSVAGDLAVDSDTLFVDVSADRVGINKSNPSTALDVSGTVTATAFAGPLTGAVTGNASTATKLETARTITFPTSGDVSGSFTFDGSANKTVTLTVKDDSHTHDGRYYTETEINDLGLRRIHISTSAPSDTNALWIDTDG
jgi:hypothetical protein